MSIGYLGVTLINSVRNEKVRRRVCVGEKFEVAGAERWEGKLHTRAVQGWCLRYEWQCEVWLSIQLWRETREWTRKMRQAPLQKICVWLNWLSTGLNPHRVMPGSQSHRTEQSPSPMAAVHIFKERHGARVPIFYCLFLVRPPSAMRSTSCYKQKVMSVHEWINKRKI